MKTRMTKKELENPKRKELIAKMEKFIKLQDTPLPKPFARMSIVSEVVRRDIVQLVFEMQEFPCYVLGTISEVQDGYEYERIDYHSHVLLSRNENRRDFAGVVCVVSIIKFLKDNKIYYTFENASLSQMVNPEK